MDLDKMKSDIDKAFEDAHRDYEYRKNDIITKLMYIQNSEINNDVMKIWINQAIDFIKEKEV